MECQEGVPFAALTTLEVGGPARQLVRCGDGVELSELLARARAEEQKIFVLGGGSNLLVADAGFDGLVIQLTDASIGVEARGDRVLVRAGAGVPWDSLVELAVSEGLGGLECLSGIPGRVGAAPMQNVGAYGQEVADTLEAVRVVERDTGAVRRLPAARCGFGYRSSHFKTTWRERYVITGVDFLLPRRAAGTVRYPELARCLASAAGGASPSLAEVRQAVLELRRGKSMVLDAADPNRRSAGSFFTNPVVDPRLAEDVRRRRQRPMPAYPVESTAGEQVKLPAAWLIEEAGFSRGDQLGRAGLSSRHALALINRGGASAADLVALASKIRRGVRAAFGITLEPEPFFLGFDRDVDELLG